MVFNRHQVTFAWLIFLFHPRKSEFGNLKSGDSQHLQEFLRSTARNRWKYSPHVMSFTSICAAFSSGSPLFPFIEQVGSGCSQIDDLWTSISILHLKKVVPRWAIRKGINSGEVASIISAFKRYGHTTLFWKHLQKKGSVSLITNIYLCLESRSF